MVWICWDQKNNAGKANSLTLKENKATGDWHRVWGSAD